MPQPLLELDLSTLQQLHGGAAYQQIARLIEQAVEDIQKRPAEERSREVSIKLKITPVIIEVQDEFDERLTRKQVEGVKLALQLDTKLPNRKSLEYDMGIGEGNKLVFNPHSPFNHRQQVLPNIVLDGQATPVRDIVPMSG